MCYIFSNIKIIEIHSCSSYYLKMVFEWNSTIVLQHWLFYYCLIVMRYCIIWCHNINRRISSASYPLSPISALMCLRAINPVITRGQRFYQAVALSDGVQGVGITTSPRRTSCANPPSPGNKWSSGGLLLTHLISSKPLLFLAFAGGKNLASPFRESK